ncbi:LrgB family protein [Heyndrickxia ginsengihumi]|uniref:LrgB family protein n=1 Tax=Heyndrickxia ginsengihumi TaxID=363870 RepID=UPI003D24ED46
MNLLLQSISVVVTVLVFWMCKKIYARWKFFFLTPLLICPILIILLLAVLHTPYVTYAKGTSLLTNLLGPATVAFAVPMYKHFALLKKYSIEVLMSIIVGSAMAITSSFLFSLWMGLSTSTVDSIVPRSITTPIAMNISQLIGGLPTMTAVFVIITGLIGMIVGPMVIRMLSIKASTAKGLLLGMGAHGAGTSRAFEIGELEGTFASLGMIVAGIVGFILTSTFFPILDHSL